MNEQVAINQLNVNVLLEWFKDLAERLGSQTKNHSNANHKTLPNSNRSETPVHRTGKAAESPNHANIDSYAHTDKPKSRVSSMQSLKLFINALPEQSLNDFGSNVFNCEAVFLFENEYLTEQITAMANISGQIGQLTILNSQMAKENNHDSIYNTVSHNFKIDDGRLMILPTGKQVVPFVIWLKMEDT